MLHATTALYTHTVKEPAKEQVDTSEPPAKENEKETGWFRWRNSALQMYGINYRWSDIVLEERDKSHFDAEDAKAYAFQGYEGLGSLRAGDRAPEAPGLTLASGLGTTTSLYSLFSPYLHTILIFAPPDAFDDVEAAVDAVSVYPSAAVQSFVITHEAAPRALPKTTVLVDREDRAARAYMIGKQNVTFVVVRPDTFIGAIVTDKSGVDRYFSKILVPSV